MDVSIGWQLGFNTNLIAATNLNEVFIARTNANDNTYFKSGHHPNEDEIVSSRMALYPNPNNGAFELEFDGEVSGLMTIHNSLSQLEFKEVLSKQGRVVISQNFSSGIYFLSFQMENQRISMRFVVNR